MCRVIDSIAGEFHMNNQHGTGKYFWPSGNIYEGKPVIGLHRGRIAMVVVMVLMVTVSQASFRATKNTAVGRFTSR